jgi:hypothetical protein
MLVSNPWCYPPCPTILVGLPPKRKNAPTWGVGARRARYLLLLEGPEKKLNFCCNPIVNHHRLGILWECSRCIAGILWECSRYITGNISPDKFHTMDRWGFGSVGFPWYRKKNEILNVLNDKKKNSKNPKKFQKISKKLKKEMLYYELRKAQKISSL